MDGGARDAGDVRVDEGSVGAAARLTEEAGATDGGATWQLRTHSYTAAMQSSSSSTQQQHAAAATARSPVRVSNRDCHHALTPDATKEAEPHAPTLGIRTAAATMGKAVPATDPASFQSKMRMIARSRANWVITYARPPLPPLPHLCLSGAVQSGMQGWVDVDVECTSHAGCGRAYRHLAAHLCTHLRVRARARHSYRSKCV